MKLPLNLIYLCAVNNYTSHGTTTYSVNLSFLANILVKSLTIGQYKKSALPLLKKKNPDREATYRQINETSQLLESETKEGIGILYYNTGP